MKSYKLLILDDNYGETLARVARLLKFKVAIDKLYQKCIKCICNNEKDLGILFIKLIDINKKPIVIEEGISNEYGDYDYVITLENS